MIYQGIVEDLEDPLKLGRVRVRVFGLHTDDRNLIPTNTLPWAYVMMPTTSASMSGIGISPGGLLRGSWVAVTFQDSENQYPIVIGSFHGIPKDPTGQETSQEELEYSDSQSPTDSSNVLKDGSGNVVTDGSGEPIKTGEPTTQPEQSTVPGKVVPSKLGSISARYESNGNPGTINRYANGSDLGGASYGSYQFASYLRGPNTPTRPTVTRSQINNSPVIQYIRNSAYSGNFTGLSPATPEFDAAWKNTAIRDKAGFLADQHLYIERTYYQVASNKLPASITNRGLAIHEAIWSMSVQLGPGGCASKFKSTIGNLDASVCDDKAIEILYNARIDTVKTDFKSSPDLWPGLVKRFNSEMKDLIKLAKTYETGECGAVVQVPVEKPVYKEDQKKDIVTETKITTVDKPTSRGERGFSDPLKKYPLYYGEADTNRLSRGVITGTVVEKKRATMVTGKEAASSRISEPSTQYNAKYPFNKVTFTESGHIIELDDTPGHERVQIYHRTGTFIELHPDGKAVMKVIGDNTLIVNENNNTIILGNNQESVDGDDNKTVSGNLNLVVYGDVNVKVNGNSTTNVTGNCSITAARIDLN